MTIQMAWGISIVGALISASIAIAFVICMERLRKPKLRLRLIETRIRDYQDNVKRPARRLRVCELKLENHNLHRCLKWCMSRNVAVHCYGYITFHNKDGDNVINDQMPIKWAKLPRVEVHPGGTKTEHSLYEVSYMDVHPGEKEILQVAARFDNDSECYGWNNESYYYLWRNPNWELEGPEDYFVKVKVVSAGLRCEDVFKLHIGKEPDDFKLEEVEKEDKDGILKIQEFGE